MTPTADTRLSRARTRLLLDSPWFGSLSMRLHITESACKTMQTDGTRLEYNPQFVESISEAELTGVVAHEVLHCALLHPYRIGSRKLPMWNKACDFAVNQMLLDQGFALPAGRLHDPQYQGMSAEQIYALLDRDQQDDQQGDDQGDEEQPGQVVAPQPGDEQDDGDGAPEPMSATDWQVAAEQATAIANKAGKLPGDCARAVKESRESETNWREILRRFVEQTVPSDYSWTMPNRRYIAAGLYLPGTVRENTPRLAVGIDTSGSISDQLLAVFSAELTQILHETRPEAIDVYYCDAEVRHAESFSPDDAEIKLSAHGGGTAFQPVLDRIADAGSEPAALIYFTDLDGPTPVEPSYPVLWVTTEATRAIAPFGETVRVAA
jgi:predicted metal-dependent peptidase